MSQMMTPDEIVNLLNIRIHRSREDCKSRMASEVKVLMILKKLVIDLGGIENAFISELCRPVRDMAFDMISEIIIAGDIISHQREGNENDR